MNFTTDELFGPQTWIHEAEFRGVKIMVRKGSTDEKAAQECLVRQCYNGEFLPIEPRDVWIDAGANIGAFSLFARSKGATVGAAIEPVPSNIEVLKMNLGASPTILFEAAVAAQAGEIDMHICRSDSNHWRHSILPSPNRDIIKVRAVTLPEMFMYGDCLKMDIEGAEIELLETVDFRSLRKISFEYHFDQDRSIARCRAIIARLESQGFEVHCRKFTQTSGEYNFFPPQTVIKARK